MPLVSEKWIVSEFSVPLEFCNRRKCMYQANGRPAPLNEANKQFLEGKFTELLEDCIEIEGVNADLSPTHGKCYWASIVYDGTNNKANRGFICFNCKPFENGKIEDLELIDISMPNRIKKDLTQVWEEWGRK